MSARTIDPRVRVLYLAAVAVGASTGNQIDDTLDRTVAPARGGVPVTGPVAGEEVAPAQQAPAQAPASDDPLAGVAQ